MLPPPTTSQKGPVILLTDQMKVAGEGPSKTGADDSIVGEQARGGGKCHNKNVIFIEREISRSIEYRTIPSGVQIINWTFSILL